MNIAAAAVACLIALGLVGLCLLGAILGSDNEDVDLREYDDWERLR